MASKRNRGRRRVADLTIRPESLCVGGVPHNPLDTRYRTWTAQTVSPCITDWTCKACGLVVHIDSSD